MAASRETGAASPGGAAGGGDGGKSSGGGPIRVLVVDDSASVRAVLRRFFSWTDDVEVVAEAADGAEAIARTREVHPDVILMDLVMPGMDGYQAIETIMERWPTPILVLSAKANRDQVQTAFDAMRRGAVDVLPKPEDTVAWRTMADALPRMLREIVASHHPRPLGETPREAAVDRRARRPAARSVPDRRSRSARAGGRPSRRRRTVPRSGRTTARGTCAGSPSAPPPAAPPRSAISSPASDPSRR